MKIVDLYGNKRLEKKSMCRTLFFLCLIDEVPQGECFPSGL
jgi:hypothetical protein